MFRNSDVLKFISKLKMDIHQRKFKQTLVLAIIILIIIAVVIVLFCFTIIPNINSDDQVTKTIIENQDHNENSNTNSQKDILLIKDNRNLPVLIVGLFLACGLILTLIILVLIICFWTFYNNQQQTHNDSSQECIITSFSGIKHFPDDLVTSNSLKVNGIDDKDNCHTVNTSPNSIFTSKSAHPITESKLNSIDPDSENVDGVALRPPSSAQAQRPLSYGSLSRSRFLSSVDEDGFHIDNFGLESDNNKEECSEESNGNKLLKRL